MFRTTRFLLFPACLFGLLLLSTPARADSINIFDGATRIGVLNYGYTYQVYPQQSYESAYFTTVDPYRGLMSDALGLQFRFFQVIYYDDEPVTWNGNIITPAATAAHSGTVVDVPAGGWDYESQWPYSGGDDLSPFYESDTDNNPVTGQPYAFPGYAYPDLHTADGISPGRMLTSDRPSLSRNGHQTLFETYLAFVDPALSASHTFDILGGFSWGMQATAQGYALVMTPTPLSSITFAGIDAAKLNELQGALNRSGFSGGNAWTVQAVSDFYPLGPGTNSPELGPTILVLSGIVLIFVPRFLRKMDLICFPLVASLSPSSSRPASRPKPNSSIATW